MFGALWRTVHPLRTLSGAHAHSLVQRALRIALNAVITAHRLVRLLGLDLNSFRRAICGASTLPGGRHPRSKSEKKTKKNAVTV